MNSAPAANARHKPRHPRHLYFTTLPIYDFLNLKGRVGDSRSGVSQRPPKTPSHHHYSISYRHDCISFHPHITPLTTPNSTNST